MEASSEDKLRIWCGPLPWQRYSICKLSLTLASNRDDLLEKQSSIFKETVSRNRELELRNEELEQELSVWKTGSQCCKGNNQWTYVSLQL
jgi:hypothetical protein